MDEDQKSLSIQSQLIGMVVSIAVCFLAAGIGGMATAGSVDSEWFVGLQKPTWNPPNWLFGPVWTALYFMMSIAAWLVWRQSGFAGSKPALGWFAFHLILNVMWSVLFFGWQQPGWAAVEIVLLWITIVVSMALFYRHSKLAAGLLIPYLLWVTFAAFLNYRIWSLNQMVI